MDIGLTDYYMIVPNGGYRFRDKPMMEEYARYLIDVVKKYNLTPSVFYREDTCKCDCCPAADTNGQGKKMFKLYAVAYGTLVKPLNEDQLPEAPDTAPTNNALQRRIRPHCIQIVSHEYWRLMKKYRWLIGGFTPLHNL